MGFSDHTPWPHNESIQTSMRMSPEQLSGYVRSVTRLQDKYAGQIDISLGLEAEYYPDFMGWLSDTRAEYGIDYLLFGNHYDGIREDHYFGAARTPDDVRRYARHAVKGIESGQFACVAHPDLFMQGYPRFDAECRAASRDIAAAARENGVLLEYNLSGFYNHFRRGAGYPCLEFWETAAQEGAQAIIGIDAHNPERYMNVELYDLAIQHLKGLGIRRVEDLAGLGLKPVTALRAEAI